MNINRKIQLAAASVIANGLLALGLLSAAPAVAATCNTTQFCFRGDHTYCVATGVSFCDARMPSGCTLSQAVCTLAPCDAGSTIILCYYTS